MTATDTTGPDAYWASLDAAWHLAFEQAWEALRFGNIAVGAVVTRPDGTVVHASRNRVADTSAPAGEVCSTSLAHAEINALSRVPFRHARELVLTTTLQPCLQCAAAIRMSPVATVRAAGHDPLWDGCHDFSSLGPWLARRPPVGLEGPRHDQLGWFGVLLSRFGPGLIPAVEEGLRACGPLQGAVIDLARALEADRWPERMAEQPVEAALADVWPQLTQLARTAGA